MSKFTKRGIFLPRRKEPAASRTIARFMPSQKVLIPLLSAEGEACRCTVKQQQAVERGARIGVEEEGEGAVFSPVAGTLSGFREMLHPLLGNVTCAVLDCHTTPPPFRGKPGEIDNLTGEAIVSLARDKGLVDELDGSSLAKKLEARFRTSLLLVADGSEQEPYSSSAWVVLNESAEQVLEGLALAARAMGAEKYHIAVQLPQKDLSRLESRIPPERLFSVGERYPAKVANPEYGEAICRIGVQACLALYHAAAWGEPPCDCVVTVAGDAIANPQNVRVPAGTLVADILHFCGLSANPEYLLLGDAMTGISIADPGIPVVAGVACLLALKTVSCPPLHTCVGCGRCVRACHAGLLPYEIMRRLDNMQYERLESLLPALCDGCGACSYVCPSGLDVTAKVLEARDARGNIFLNWGDGDDL